jgi:N-acetylglutamate synthase-like GNAT family acetyltransferase
VPWLGVTHLPWPLIQPSSFNMASEEHYIITSYNDDNSELCTCQELLASTQLEYNNPTAYVDNAINTDMADIKQHYLDVERADYFLLSKRSTGQIIGQIAIQPLAIGDKDVYNNLATHSIAQNIPAEKICELRRMALRAQYRQLGLGLRLLNHCIATASHYNYKLIHLTTLMSMQSACRFYEKYDFTAGIVEIFNIAYKARPSNNSNTQECLTLADKLSSLLDLTLQRRVCSPAELTAEESVAALLSPVQSNQLYIIHYWRTIS